MSGGWSYASMMSAIRARLRAVNREAAESDMGVSITEQRLVRIVVRDHRVAYGNARLIKRLREWMRDERIHPAIGFAVDADKMTTMTLYEADAESVKAWVRAECAAANCACTVTATPRTG